jgi:hypothetical protein
LLENLVHILRFLVLDFDQMQEAIDVLINPLGKRRTGAHIDLAFVAVPQFPDGILGIRALGAKGVVDFPAAQIIGPSVGWTLPARALLDLIARPKPGIWQDDRVHGGRIAAVRQYVAKLLEQGGLALNDGPGGSNWL